ncbi:outer membrane protein assembly factor BamA [Marinobacter oulmenensis]|uniref:Outer membrane protein assembly factor BamA n=1 Tax=Marinobacter oulmenensis TaxID=643747 RepID=A0A840UPR0_9GAMM|nr:outer membrane protein assembly factor BamA [Marinobacter oulmenensis]MBB5322598.1 outer membrane protein insertion porin family [Marinobacter oulmenensis]
MRRSLLAVAIGLAINATGMKPALADEFTVADIEVEGLQRVSAGSVFSSFPVNIGQQIDETRLASAIKELFRSGLFTDIEVARDGNVLIVNVEERPSISSIEIEGNDNIESDMLLDALSDAGMQEGEVFQRATLERLELEILRSYIAQGRYNARVTATAEPQPQNRVAIHLDINEGSVASIQHINIIGNRDFSEEELTDLFELRTSSWWNSLTNKDKYARERLSGDLETLRSYYLDRGYLDFNVESSQVSISPDKQQVFIAISINEGKQYTISDIRLRGDLIVGEEELRKLIPVEEGDVFSRAKMTSISESLSYRLGREGYAFANVDAVPEPDGEDTATVTFYVEPGKRAYVRRINFEGNVSTKDEVLRQEMTQMEGGVASTDRIEFSKDQLDRLGFFQTVEVDTVPVPGTDDLVDVNYSVQEQPTGSLSASVGFSQSSGIILGASVSENNFFGTGKRASFGVNVSDSVKSANISYTDPYYTVDGVSRGFSVFGRQTDYDEEDISSYLLDEYGAKLTFGYPTDAFTRINFGLGVTQSKVKDGRYTSTEVLEFMEEEGNSFVNYFLSGSWRRSTLNRGVLPTDGYSHSLSLDVAVPGSDLTFYKTSYKTNYYFPLTDSQRWVVRLRGEIGYGDGYGDRSRMPFYEHYYAGGFGSVRGYEANSLGNTVVSNYDGDEDPFGGNLLTEAGMEFIVPTPFAGDTRSMRTSLFVDAGQVFDTDSEPAYDPDLGEIRAAAGVSFQWITAVGPLAFSLAKPLNDQAEDDTQVFQFSLGQTF